jgi:urease accessory protein
MGAATTTPTSTAITTDLLRLLTWLSPAFPTGAFAYSHGLEWAVEFGDVRDAASLRGWLADVLALGAGRSELILLRHAHAGEDVTELALATQPTRERREETIMQGNAFRLAARPWGAIQDERDTPHAVAVGQLAGARGIDVEATAAAWLHGFASALVSAAVRLVPLGQTDGLAVLAALEAEIVALAAATRDRPLDEIGGACFRSDIAAIRHETQYTRLFRS